MHHSNSTDAAPLNTNAFAAEYTAAILGAEVVEWHGKHASFSDVKDKITYDLMQCVGLLALEYETPEDVGDPDKVTRTAMVHLYPDEAAEARQFLTELRNQHFAPNCTELYLAGARFQKNDDCGLGMVNYIKDLLKQKPYRGFHIAGECIGGSDLTRKCLMVMGGRVFCPYAESPLAFKDPVTGTLMPDWSASPEVIEISKPLALEQMMLKGSYCLSRDQQTVERRAWYMQSENDQRLTSAACWQDRLGLRSIS
jgi:hypothetical protein